MKALLKSELMKLFTIRSTYIMIGISLALVILLSFYFEGYKGNTGSPSSELQPTALHEISINTAGLGIMFANIIAILFVAHEYRYNTIAYTLTANAQRLKVLLAKLATISWVTALFGIAVVATALASYQAGVSLRGVDLPPQEFDVWLQFLKVAFYYASYGILGIIVAVIVRSVVAAVAGILIYSTVIEPLLGVIFSGVGRYLPMAAIDGTVAISLLENPISTATAFALTGAYLGTGLLVAGVLFSRRDALTQ